MASLYTAHQPDEAGTIHYSDEEHGTWQILIARQLAALEGKACDEYQAGLARLETKVAPFVRPGLGCLCVIDQPWVTTAESCELAMAMLRLGRRASAATLLDWQNAQRDADGAYWMGWQFEEAIFWPQEKPSWTQAAVILAADAVHAVTSASGVLTAD